MASQYAALLRNQQHSPSVRPSSSATSQVDRDGGVLITNPELMKSGLDLSDFPTIVLLQTGYIYPLQQAAPIARAR